MPRAEAHRRRRCLPGPEAAGEPHLPSPRDAGHDVFAVNPNAAEVEGVRAYAAVSSIPERVDGVVVVTTPEVSRDIVADCAAAGVPRVWLHRGLGPGSVSQEAIAVGREHGISVIPGGCPNMFGATSDPGHVCLRAMLRATGKLPRRIDRSVAP
ncbi:MAG TPA: CoA-binding protein [Solirubrobacteraceae bacterium]